MDARGVTKGIRRVVWSALRDEGFSEFTGRGAWRRGDGGVDAVFVGSVGALFDAVGCTSCSVSATVGVLLDEGSERLGVPVRPSGMAAPHPGQCHLEMFVEKSLEQPWFRPFSAPPPSSRPMAKHRAALKKILRRERHDRRDIWFVLEDGSNIEEVLADLAASVLAATRYLAPLHDRAVLDHAINAGQLATSVWRHPADTNEWPRR
jgi:hypothetical protein